MTKHSRGEEKSINMYEVIPRPCVLFETDSEGRITLLKPKFTSKFAHKYLAPLSKHKYYRIHLDDIGTAVWKRIDGKMSAGIIAEDIEKEFGEKVKPVYERVGTFLVQLKTAKFIEY